MLHACALALLQVNEHWVLHVWLANCSAARVCLALLQVNEHWGAACVACQLQRCMCMLI